jgi:hypothetical protein
MPQVSAKRELILLKSDDHLADAAGKDLETSTFLTYRQVIFHAAGAFCYPDGLVVRFYFSFTIGK